MRKFLAAAALALALTLTAGVTPAPAASAMARYAVVTDGILQFTYYWDPYARAWILIRVELYFGD